MKAQYVTAVVDLIKNGTSVEEALDRVTTYMKLHGHEKLLPTVLRGVLRELEVVTKTMAPHITVAKEADAVSEAVAQALTKLEAQNPVVTVDDSIIGGYVVEHNHKQINASYKQKLITLYRNITK